VGSRGDTPVGGLGTKAEAFLADRTNGRAIVTLLCLSSVVVVVVCDVMYCG